MCFTVKATLKAQQLAKKYGARAPDLDDIVKTAQKNLERNQADSESSRDRLKAFDHPALLTLVDQEIRPLKWGLVPRWVKTRDQALDIRKQTLNARSESAFDKASFRDCIQHRRCIIPIEAYYEWQHQGKEKIPYIIRPAHDDLFSLAGLWDTWISPQSQTPVHTCTILTCEANATMAEIHNSKMRMPVILSMNDIPQWLSQDTSPESLKKLLIPSPDQWLAPESLLA